MDAARKAKLGQRWVCFSCAGKFYDMNKPDPICPKCQANQHESPLFQKAKPARKKARKKPAKVVRPIEPPEEEPEIERAPDDEVDLEMDELDLDESEDLSGLEVADD
jgi:hypothetical protein